VPPAQLCSALHPHTGSCNVAFVDFLVRHMLRVSLPLYLPLKLLTTLLRGAGGGRKRAEAATGASSSSAPPAAAASRAVTPLGTARHVAASVLRSSLFLSLYVTGSYRVVCAFNQLGLRNRTLMSVGCGFVAGGALLLEPADRQTDLVLFCAMHALRCTTLLLSKLAWIPRPTGAVVALAHTAAWATIFAVFELRPDVATRGWFGSLLHMLVGHRGSLSRDADGATRAAALRG
jgi:prepilin-type processing-associated H-X9-DG protein